MSFALDGVGLTHGQGSAAAPGAAALSDIRLSAAQGESIALIGPSGAGKTSLLTVLGTAWAAQPQQLRGAVQVLGEDPSALKAPALRALRARIGTVHQAPPLPARQRVVTSVLAGRLGQWPAWKSLASLVYPMDTAGARAALARVELEHKLFARCDQLSGGQLQRAGIARVLYQRAALVLADEPVSALDPALALATVRLLVEDARARGATLVASLHAVDLALGCFARIVGIKAGRIVFDLPAAQVSEAQLQALYAGEGQQLPTLLPSTAAPLPMNACR